MIDQEIPESVKFGKSIRMTRRNIGLSQEALSSYLGITQARISRWETGLEEMPRKHRLRYIDLISNKNGKLDPLLDRLIRSDPSFAITSADTSKILRESKTVLNAFKLNRCDVDGTAHARVFDSEWKTRQSNKLDFYLTEYVRDIELAGTAGSGSGNRFRIKMFAAHLTGYDRVYIRQNWIVGPSQREVDAKFLEFLKLDDLEGV